MKNRTVILTFILIACINSSALAQSGAREIYTHTQSWFSINSTMRLNNKWGLIMDVHTRRKDFLAGESFYFRLIRNGPFWS